MEPIILASGSLRRQEYFRLLSLPFSIMPSPVEEHYDGNADPKSVAEDLAVRKVNKIVEILKGRIPPWIVGADTLVTVDGKVYGKPKDREAARSMLSVLQGRDHFVITAVALYKGKEKTIDCRSVSSTVTFAPLRDSEIEWYLNTGEWQGVAGSYKVQGLASCFISEIKGSYSSIVGLPMREFYVMLKENGYPYGD
ncbi:Maf family protein [Leadbettera azotonutricia]|uniref:dTTP/UTP pyrophosphatase n=1 Tax=Leadbettera azotonutricia (strain ATCC BAA-888 / DSM 13862 / ZAS-9) TaxID=545695 RepID=F5YBG9_LEAAZ|nr:Maf family protein [Leadbettera azotonutricia]AEF81181.1 septum formation protein Maf [Leadbettera azotonutricia ZAS-9]